MNSFALVSVPGDETINLLEGEFIPYNHSQELQNKYGFFISGFGLNQTHLVLEVKEIFSITADEVLKLKIQPSSHIITNNTADKLHYIQIVEEAIQLMSKTDATLKKIVLANSKSNIIDYNPLQLFLSLVKMYPNSFVYLTQIDKENMWIGASPELLLSTTTQNRFKTTSLAGTLTHKNATWTNKEFEEQEFVTQYILEELSNQGIATEVKGPIEIQNGHLRHLQSEITIKGENLNAFELINLLHPTPAINGIPKNAAYNFIKEKEKEQRGYYSGIIGLVQTEKTIAHVNLRCARIAANGLTLYAGAGITKDSNAAKEWEETQNKMKIIENLL